MRVVTRELSVTTHGRGYVEISDALNALVLDSDMRVGLCCLWIRHTSASLLVCENADSEVLRDLERFMARLVPDGDALFRHVDEGDDDMPAHVRAVLTHTDLNVPVRDGRLALGTWQGVFLWEHRRHGHQRRVEVTLLGE
ncbi:MAG: YjbQ family protein [Proteobacteria bacterium]|nr:YjbQ family protein [Pseudomonadota bacterium]